MAQPKTGAQEFADWWKENGPKGNGGGAQTWADRRAARTSTKSRRPPVSPPEPPRTADLRGSVTPGSMEPAATNIGEGAAMDRAEDFRPGAGYPGGVERPKDYPVRSDGRPNRPAPPTTTPPTRDTAPPGGSPDAKASGTQTSPGGKALGLAEVEAWLGGKMANNFQGTGVPLTENGSRQLGVKSQGNYTVIQPSDPIAAQAFGKDWVDANNHAATDPSNPQAGNSPGPDTTDQDRSVSMGQENSPSKRVVEGVNGAVFGGGYDDDQPGLVGTISAEERARRDSFLGDGDSMAALKGLDKHLGRTRLNGQTYSIGPEGKLIETTREEDWQLRHGGKNMSADREGFASLVQSRLSNADSPEDKAETLKSTYLNNNPDVKEGGSTSTIITPEDPIAAKAFGQDWVDDNKGIYRSSVEDTPDGRGSIIPAPNMNQSQMITPDDPIAAEAFGSDWVGAAKKRTSFRDHNAAQNR